MRYGMFVFVFSGYTGNTAPVTILHLSAMPDRILFH